MAGGHDLDEMQLVICTIQRLDLGAPGCDTLARTYAGAVATTSEAFYVLLVQQGGNEPICQGVYAPDGSLIAQPDLESP